MANSFLNPSPNDALFFSLERVTKAEIISAQKANDNFESLNFNEQEPNPSTIILMPMIPYPPSHVSGFSHHPMGPQFRLPEKDKHTIFTKSLSNETENKLIMKIIDIFIYEYETDIMRHKKEINELVQDLYK
jgi:hypothetical protein